MQRRNQSIHVTQSGFTLIEVLLVVVLVGILAAITAPSWLAFLNRQRVGAVRSDLLTTLANIQEEAKQKRSYQTVWIDVANDTPRIFSGGNNANNIEVLTPQDLGGDSVPAGTVDLKAFRCADDPCTAASTDWVEVTDINGPCDNLDKACFQFNYTGAATDPNLEVLPDTATPYTGGGPRVPFKVEISNPRSSTKSCVIVANLLGNLKSGNDGFCDIPPGDWLN